MRKHSLAILFLFFLIGLFFAKGIVSKNHIFAPVDTIYLFSPWNEYKKIIPQNFQQADALYQFIPWRTYAYDQLKKGNFPLWNPYEYGGIPFFANDQSGVLSLFNTMGLPFSFDKGFLLIDILKLLLAAIGMYLFLNLFSLSIASCIIGSIAFTFSALMITWLYHPVSSVAAFIPWLFWAFERLYRNVLYGTKSNRFISLSIAAFIVALSFFSGHSETTANALFGVIIYYTTKIVFLHKKIIASMFMLVSSIMLGFLLAAVQTLPFLQLLFDSAPFYNRSSLPLNPVYTKIYLPFEALIAWLAPSMNGNPSFSYFWMHEITSWHEAVPYIGITPLLLGIITLIRIRPDYKRLLPFWIMVFLGFGMAYGIPGIKWLTILPLLRAGGAFRYTILMEFGLSALSAFGLEMLLQRTPVSGSKQHTKAAFVLLTICSSAFILYFITRYDIYLSPRTFNAIQVILSILFITGTLWFVVKVYVRKIYSWMVPAGLIALTITDLFIFGIGYNPDVPAKDFYPVIPIISKLKTLDTKNYSFYASGSIIPPDTAMVYHVRDFRGYDMIASIKYQNFLYLMFPEEHPNIGESGLINWPEKPSPVIAGMAGIRYFIFPKGFDPNQRGNYFRLIGTYNDLSLWANTLAVPLYYLANQAVPASDTATALQLLSQSAPENVNTPVVEGITDRRLYKPGQIRLTDTGQKPGEYVFDVQAGSEGFLVLNEPFYPGWHAYMNNRPIIIHRTNYLFQGIELPQGSYTVKFEYKPGIFYTGLKISITMFILMSVVILGIVMVNRIKFKKGLPR